MRKNEDAIHDPYILSICWTSDPTSLATTDNTANNEKMREFDVIFLLFAC